MAREIDSVGGEDVDWLTDGLADEPSERQINKIKIREDLARLDQMTSIDEVSSLLERINDARAYVRSDLENFHLKAKAGQAQASEFGWSGRARIALRHLDINHQRVKKHLKQIKHGELIRRQQAAKLERSSAPKVISGKVVENTEDHAKITEENNRNARLRMKIRLVQELNWQQQFVDCAREMLPAEEFRRLMLEANKRLMAALDAADV